MTVRELVDFMAEYPDFNFEEFLKLEKKRVSCNQTKESVRLFFIRKKHVFL